MSKQIPITALRKSVQDMVAQHKRASADPTSGPGPDATDPNLRGKVSPSEDADSSVDKHGLPGSAATATAATDPSRATHAPGKDSTQSPGISNPSGSPEDGRATSPTADVVDGATVKTARDNLMDAAASIRQLLRPDKQQPAQTRKNAAPAVTLEKVDPAIFQKIAYDMLSSNEGAELVNSFYTRELGREAAAGIVKQALELRNSLARPSAGGYGLDMSLFQKLAGNATQPQEFDYDAFVDSLPPHVKQAAAEATRATAINLSHLRTQEEVEQYHLGFQDALMLAKKANEGEPDPSIPAGGEAEPSPEEIISMLMEMGLSEEEIMMLLQQVAQQAGGGGAPPEAGMDPAAAGGMPPSM